MASNNFINETKICTSCGRLIEYRKKWEKNWPEIKYCSDECRRNKNKFDYRSAILKLLEERAKLKTICPSELLAPEQKLDKVMLEHIRRSARLLAADNKVEIIQNGKVVDSTSFKGAILIRLKAN